MPQGPKPLGSRTGAARQSPHDIIGVGVSGVSGVSGVNGVSGVSDRPYTDYDRDNDNYNEDDNEDEDEWPVPLLKI